MFFGEGFCVAAKTHNRVTDDSLAQQVVCVVGLSRPGGGNK